MCKTEIVKFVWSKRQKRSIKCTYCYPCWKKNRLSKAGRNDCPSDETSALLIGVITEATAITDVGSSSICSQGNSHGRKEIVLDHHIFHSQDGWKKSESLPHPTLRLQLTTDDSDYSHMGATCPRIAPSYVTVVADTGAQSCLWGLRDFYRCSLSKILTFSR